MRSAAGKGRDGEERRTSRCPGADERREKRCPAWRGRVPQPCVGHAKKVRQKGDSGRSVRRTGGRRRSCARSFVPRRSGRLLVAPFRSASGWGTWIRTRTKRVRAARSTVKLFPSGGTEPACNAIIQHMNAPGNERGRSEKAGENGSFPPARARNSSAPASAMPSRRSACNRTGCRPKTAVPRNEGIFSRRGATLAEPRRQSRAAPCADRLDQKVAVGTMPAQCALRARTESGAGWYSRRMLYLPSAGRIAKGGRKRAGEAAISKGPLAS